MNIFISYSKKVSIFIMLSAVLFACEDSDDTVEVDPTPTPDATEKSSYVLSFQSIAADNSTLDFILDVPTLDALESGVLSVEGKGIPQLGWRFAAQAANTVFTFGFSDDNKAVAYQLDDEGAVKESTNFIMNNNLDKSIAVAGDDKLIVVDLIRTASAPTDQNPVPSVPELIFTIVDGKTGKSESQATNAIDNRLDFQNDPENPVNLTTSYLPWVTGMEVRGNKLFVAYHKLSVDGSFRMVDADKAYVAVLNYPAFTLDTLIEDTRANSIGVNSQTGLHQTEEGTIYAFSAASSNAMGIFGEASHPSSIIRIPAGSNTFDTEYFFDVENAPNGGKIFWMDYIGNNKAIARILIKANEPQLPDWSVFSEQGGFFKLVVLDLENKQVTDVTGIPPHANRYSANTYVENGKAYISARVGAPTAAGSVSAAGTTNIYIVDPETATATKGATIDGAAVKGIFKIKK